MSILFSWTVIGILVPTLIGAGVGVLSLTPAEFSLAKICFVLAAIILLGKVGIWALYTDDAPSQRIIVLFIVSGLTCALLVESLRWIEVRQGQALPDSTAKHEEEAKRLAEEKEKVSPKLHIDIGVDTMQGIYKPPLIRYRLGITNTNRDSMPILKLRVEFNFRNVIAEVHPQIRLPTDSPTSVEVYHYKEDGSLDSSYVEQPRHPELNKTFSFEIQKASINRKLVNQNFAYLFVEKWDEQNATFSSDIIIDVSKQFNVHKKSGEAGSYNGSYLYEISGKQFLETVRGSIPN